MRCQLHGCELPRFQDGWILDSATATGRRHVAGRSPIGPHVWLPTRSVMVRGFKLGRRTFVWGGFSTGRLKIKKRCPLSLLKELAKKVRVLNLLVGNNDCV